jgi:ankyrin repeat protein
MPWGFKKRERVAPLEVLKVDQSQAAPKRNTGWPPTQEEFDQAAGYIKDRFLAGFDELLSRNPQLGHFRNAGDRATLLHLAVRKKASFLIREALCHGCDPNAGDAFGETPLYHAAVSGDTEAVLDLLHAGGDPHRANDDGNTPADVAPWILAETQNSGFIRVQFTQGLKSRDVERMREILDHYPSLVNVDLGADDSPLLAATSYGSGEIVSLLLEHGANPNVQNVTDETPLYRAVSFGKVEVTRLLLESGADPNVHEWHRGFTPLHEAAESNEPELIRLLVAHGARLDGHDKDGRTPLNIAVGCDNQAARIALRKLETEEADRA